MRIVVENGMEGQNNIGAFITQISMRYIAKIMKPFILFIGRFYFKGIENMLLFNSNLNHRELINT